jgi:hypothetical protein
MTNDPLKLHRSDLLERKTGSVSPERRAQLMAVEAEQDEVAVVGMQGLELSWWSGWRLMDPRPK